jgi:hypothetical protein
MTLNEEREQLIGTNDKRAKRAYQRAWRKANKDKVRETNKRYWMKKAQQAMKIEGNKQ